MSATLNPSVRPYTGEEFHSTFLEGPLDGRQCACAGIDLSKLDLPNRVCRYDGAVGKLLLAPVTLAGIELMHMIRKGQLRLAGKLRPAQQFYSLAG